MKGHAKPKKQLGIKGSFFTQAKSPKGKPPKGFAKTKANPFAKGGKMGGRKPVPPTTPMSAPGAEPPMLQPPPRPPVLGGF